MLGRGWAINGAVASSTATLVLALLPEMLEFSARRQLRLRASATKAKHAGDDAAPAGTLLEFRLAGMGCVSCIKAVADTLEASPLVTKYDLNFEAEHLKVWVGPQCDRYLGDVSDRVVAALADAGFTATVVEPPLGSTAAAAGEKPDEGSCDGDSCCDGGGGGGEIATKDGGGDDDDAVLSWVSVVTAGLLSSSCCLLQLGLNSAAMLGVMNVGCAGFNKVNRHPACPCDTRSFSLQNRRRPYFPTTFGLTCLLTLRVSPHHIILVPIPPPCP